MKPFASLALDIQGLIGLPALLSIFEMTGLLIFAVFVKKRFRGIFAALWATNYVLLQCIQCCVAWAHQPERSLAIVTAFAGLPWLIPLLLGSVLAVLGAVLLLSQKKWNSNHITAQSIKQAVDHLPVGICYHNRDGVLLMKNDVMERVAYTITGERLMNGRRFRELLAAGTLQNGCSMELIAGKRVIVLPDGTVYALSVSAEEQAEPGYVLLWDLTEEYRKNRLLTEKKEQLETLSRRLERYNREITSIIAEREVLTAKIKLHDELGALLLASKHYLLRSENAEQKEILLQKIRRNIDFLLQESQTAETDEYVQLLQVADALGVSVEMTGELPEEKPQKTIVLTAMHEFLTNTLRHAHGTKIYVQLTNNRHAVRAVLRNNGLPPSEDFTEKGGLKSLRMLVEQAGGRMLTQVEASLVLTITLPEGGTKNAISRTDRG